MTVLNNSLSFNPKVKAMQQDVNCKLLLEMLRHEMNLEKKLLNTGPTL